MKREDDKKNINRRRMMALQMKFWPARIVGKIIKLLFRIKILSSHEFAFA